MTRTRASFSWLPGSAIAALILIAGLVGGSWTDSLEFTLYDHAQRTSSASATPEVVILSIDHASLSKLGEWPWSGETHARLLSTLQSGGARAAAFTMPFDTNQGLPALTQALTAYGKAVLPVEVSFGRVLPGESNTTLPQRFAVAMDNDSVAAARTASTVRWPRASLMVPGVDIGHVALALDSDRIARRDLSAVRVGDALLPSMATALAANALQLDIGEVRFDAARTLHFGGAREVPLDSELAALPQAFTLHGSGSIPRYSYWDVYSGQVPPQALADKIVIIGFDDVNAGGGVATPREADAPPALVIASTTASLLQDSLYSRPLWARGLEGLLAGAVIAVAGWALPLMAPMFAIGAGTLLALLMVLLELWLLRSTGSISHLILPSVALLVAALCQAVIELTHRANTAPHEKDPATTLLTLAQTFQKQGQLDLAFETYCRCPIDPSAMDLLYSLGMDFERRRQLQKAQAVYAYMSQYDQNFKDLRVRRARLGGEQPATSPAVHSSSTSSSHTAGPSFPPRPVHPPAATRIQMLGRYGIERELGKGAMGVVYLGRDPKINRVVAIKAISLAEEFDQEDLAEARARFFREAEMAGRLNHPAIVTVYDAGEDQGLAYIAMEYLQGQHLSAFTTPDQLFPPKTVMLLAARVAEALHYAHRQNVVHRDIKPANIMFNSETDELKITDFGIARLTDVSRTKTGIVLGTPSFMSPEQLEGRSLDGRSDLFALGVSLYQLLTGYLPFRADSMPRLMHKIATEPHVPIRTLRSDLPACTDALIDKALAKDSDDRFQTGAEMAAALRRCAQGT
jgi:serine/threonine-protein kinase